MEQFEQLVQQTELRKRGIHAKPTQHMVHQTLSQFSTLGNLPNYALVMNTECAEGGKVLARVVTVTATRPHRPSR